MLHLFLFEWLHIRKSGAFWGTLIVLPLLIGFSLYLGSERVNQQHQRIAELHAYETKYYGQMHSMLVQIEQGEAEVENWWEDPSNPLVLGQFGQSGRHVFLEPKTLSAFSAGQLDILPWHGRVRLNNVDPLGDNALENPFIQVAGTFDFAFVLVWLIPLFIIVMGYNVISSERERGTYALLQSQPVSMRTILFQKLAFRFLVVFGIILLSVIGWALVFGISVFNGDGLLLFGVIFLYAAFWFLFCAVFNLLKTSSAVNAVGLAGVWVIFLLIIPSIITLIVTSLHPIPSRALWITEQRSIQQAVQAEGDKLFELWVVDHPEEFVEGDTPRFHESWMRRFVLADTIREKENDAEHKFEEPRQRQAQLASQLQLLSPPIALQSWLERKAGTDIDRLRTLDRRMAAFQQDWKDFFVPRLGRLEFFKSEEFSEIPSPGS